MSEPTAEQFAAVKADIVKLLHQPEYDDGSAGPVLVRLAWHSSGTYDIATDTGGSNGAGMRYEHEGGDPANAGLQHARVFLEPIESLHPWITYSDLWTLAGAVAIESLGGPHIPWQGGRTDFTDDTKLPPRGRLPDGAQGAAHVRAVFSRMGFSDREMVALSGAHSLGRCHADRSGFEGQWVVNPTRFSNQYYRLLTKLPWEATTLASGVTQFITEDADAGVQLMMLPSDMALRDDPEFRVWVDRYAQDKAVFFEDFARAFGRLLELGLRRDGRGRVVNTDNVRGGYVSAAKKEGEPRAEGSGVESTGGSEAEVLERENAVFRRRGGARL